VHLLSLPLLLNNGPFTELDELVSHDLDVASHLLPSILEFLQPVLQLGSVSLLLLGHFNGLGHSHHENFILLIEISDELVLPLNDSLVFFDLLEGVLGSLLGVERHVRPEVVQGIDFFIESSDLIVLNDDQIIQFDDLFLDVSLSSFVLLKHTEERVDALIARLFEIRDDLLTGLDLLLVGLQISSYLFGILDKTLQVLVLSMSSVVKLREILHAHIEAYLLEYAFVLGLGLKVRLRVALHFGGLLQTQEGIGASVLTTA